jgi:intracellular sulfur oxidation DsrE/DsrF family protein
MRNPQVRARPSFLPLLLLLLLIPGLVSAEKPADTSALAGVDSGKIAWDINMADAKKMLLYLKVMDETYEDLKRQGVEPDMVLTFRGPSVTLITSDRTDVPLDEEPHLDGVAEQLKAMLKKPNVRAEACSVATRLTGVDAETLLPGVEHVGNTFVSQIGYQAKGYAIIPIM